MKLQEILKNDNPKELRSLFGFKKTDSDEIIALKFNLWSRKFFPQYFKSPDAPKHADMDLHNLQAYRGEIAQYVDVAFRGAAKTARTKLFISFAILNDRDKTRRFIRCLSSDGDNSQQSVTDIYNMLIQPKIRALYPETFEKTEIKREERMGSFTTSTGIKVLAKQIGVEQRGKIMDDAKSDFDWYDDFETKTTIRSALLTRKIWDNMEEARTGLALGGSSIYTCNYFSESGNVHTLVTKSSSSKVVDIWPIEDAEGNPTWERYSKSDIAKMREDDDDFEGERLCKPNASKDIYFDRQKLEAMPILQPIKTLGEFKIFREYKAGHRIASGHDVAGGVGLDSSTSAFIDFDTIPAQVVGTFKNNMIQPESFGDEIYTQGNRFGGCLQAVENNKYDAAILKAKQLGANLYKTKGREIKVNAPPPTIYGWNTNSLTKGQMLSSLKLAIEDGLIELNDLDLINEAKSYTRNDLIDSEPDARLATRHFDLLIACAIAWQMKDRATAKAVKPTEQPTIWQRKESTNPAV